MIEIDCTQKIPRKTFTKDDYIFNQTPTQRDIEECEKNYKMLITLIKKGSGTIEEFLEEYQLKSSMNHCIVEVSQIIPYAQVKEEILKWFLDGAKHRQVCL